MQLAAHVFIRDRRFLNAELVEILEGQLIGPEPPVGIGVLRSTLYTLGSVARPLVPALNSMAKLTGNESDRHYLLRLVKVLEASG
jgi:hypothetical protein